jgi:hypothetical protein
LRILLVLKLLSSLYLTTAFAQYTDENIWVDPVDKDVDYRKIEDEKSSLLRDENILYENGNKIGVKDDRHYTGADNNDLSLQYYISRRFRNLSNTQGLEVHYGRRFQDFWLRTFASFLTTRFEEISENKSSGQFKPEDVTENLIFFGVGPGYRFRLDNHIWNFERIFHTVDAFVTYVLVNEQITSVPSAEVSGLPYKDLSYSGWGFRADYGIHYRTSHSFRWGLRLTYNAALVKRAEEFTGEDSNQRRMTISWLTFGAEVGYYF